jgi:hypothetical protein
MVRINADTRAFAMMLLVVIDVLLLDVVGLGRRTQVLGFGLDSRIVGVVFRLVCSGSAFGRRACAA